MTVIVSRTWFSRAVWEMKPTSARPGLVVTAASCGLGDTARVAWAKSTATMPLTVTAMLRLPSRTRRGRRAARRVASRSGTGRRVEQAVSRAWRRGGRAASARASTVLVRAARRAGMITGQRRDGQSGCYHQRDNGQGQLRCSGGTEQAGAGVGEQRRGQPAGEQAGRCGDDGEREVLGQEYCRDERGRAADRLQQPDPAVLLGHPAADDDRQAADGEQRQEPAAHEEDLLLVGHEEAVLAADHLPRDDIEAAGVVGVAAWVEPVGESLRAAGLVSFRFSTYPSGC